MSKKIKVTYTLEVTYDEDHGYDQRGIENEVAALYQGMGRWLSEEGLLTTDTNFTVDDWQQDYSITEVPDK